MCNDIIECDGKYLVHPTVNGGWAVVNGETGQVRCEKADCEEAVRIAKSLNE